MSKFTMPDWSLVLTFGECLDPAMEVETEEQARAYLDGYVGHIMRVRDSDEPVTHEKALEIAKAIIGWWTGYQDAATAERVMRLFDCAHPIFGHARPDAAEAFAAGKRMAEGGGA